MRPVVKIGEICESIFAGGDKPQHFSKEKTDEYNIPVYANGVDKEGLVGYTDVAKVDNVCLTVSGRGTIGYSVIRRTPFVPIVRLIVAVPSKNLDIKYFWYCLKGLDFNDTGVAIPQLTVPKFKEHKISLPPLETQKVIVAKLDQIFAELDQTKSEIQKNLDNTDELWKSALNQAFQGDWEMKKLGEVTEIQNGGTPKTEKKEYWDGDILWITPKDMGELNSKYVEDTSRKISKLGLNNSSAKLLPINSVILSSRAPIGYVAINTKPISTNQGCKGIIPNDNLKAEYLYYFLILSNKLLNSLGSGATFKELSSSKLGEVKLPVPPLSEQEKIVEHLDQVSKEVKDLKSQYQSQLDNLEELKKSVLDKAFRGEMG